MSRIVLIFLAALAFVAGVTSISAQDSPPVVRPDWDDLEPGIWTSIPGGEGTICSTGTPYSFYVRPSSQPSSKLLIHFQGGGACWMGQNCDRDARPTYDAYVDESDDPTGNLGIGDFDNPENPFIDYNMVFAPYCTADVHLGSSTATYPSGDSEVTINHNGYPNASDVLDWMTENFPVATDVFVTGCSAGSIPSPFYVQRVAQAYDGARIVQLGDASGSYRNVTGILTELFRTWGTFDILGPQFAQIQEDELTFESLYTVMANLYPDVQFAQYNAAFDLVQTSFIVLAGLGSPNTLEMLQDNHADIRASLNQDNFHAFTAGGSTHCITVTPDMYTFAASGVRFVDWLTALVNGDPVEDVMCSGDCKRVERIAPR